MEVKENQQFTTFDSFSVLGLIGAVFLLIGSIVSNAMVDQRPATARFKAIQIARQLMHTEALKLKIVPDRKMSITHYQTPRSPASILAKTHYVRTSGRIGIDPWGEPYYYRIQTSGDQVFKVQVISSGPDRKLSVSADIIHSVTAGDLSPVHVTGDDIAVVQK